MRATKAHVEFDAHLKPNIALSDDQRTAIVEVLNALLADEFVLYTKTRNYHWNVIGPQFSEFHAFFEEQYKQLSEIVDEVAERARALGGKAVGTLSEFSQNTRLSEHPGRYPDTREMISNLLHDHEAVIRVLREEIKTCAERYEDEGTANFLTDRLVEHEKMAWMLRAFLEGKG